MPTYMTQFSYTTEAWAALARKPEDRGAAVAALLEQLDCRLISIYYSMGEYDGFILFEAPNEANASTGIVAATVPGHLKATKTTPLFTMQEMMDIVGKAGGLVYPAPKG